MAGEFNFVFEFIDESISRSMMKAMISADKASSNLVKKARNDMIKEWFGDSREYLHFRNISEIKNGKKRLFSSGNGGTYTIESYDNTSLVEPFSAIDDLYSLYHDLDVPSNEFVANLVYKEGIIGLPAYASTYKKETGKEYTGRGFYEGYNTNFTTSHTNQNLENWIINNPKWNNVVDDISMIIIKNIEF